MQEAVFTSSTDEISTEVKKLLSPDELEARLRAIGAVRYHVHHPFHKLLHAGRLSRGQVQAWALNRYCYQQAIPLKDAALMARMQDADLRRIWRKRLADHDGDAEGEGGIARWLYLAQDVGVPPADVKAMRGTLPATRFAVEAYIRYVREKSLLGAIASSLTEMFAPTIIAERMTGMLANYEYVSARTLSYFDKRLYQAPEDATFALDYVKRHAQTPAQQEEVLEALVFKCDVLWAQLDALYHAYVTPGHIPPGALVPMVS